jgi:hypothetical protein
VETVYVQKVPPLGKRWYSIEFLVESGVITKASVGEEPGAGPRSSGKAKSARRDTSTWLCTSLWRGGRVTGRSTLTTKIFRRMKDRRAARKKEPESKEK